MGYLNNTGLTEVWSRIKQLVSTKADLSHTHSHSDITDTGTLKFTGASTASYDGSSDVTVNIPTGGGGSGAAWGDITGTLSNQSDLQDELDTLSNTIDNNYNTLNDGKQDKHEPHVLWSGGAYMNASQTITLSENISAQPHGVVLHFQAYSSGVQNYRHQYYFIPRTHVASYNGSGLLVPLGQEMSSSDGSMLMTGKYLYVYNNSITGYTYNSKSKSAGYVLTQVIGV